MVRPRQQQCSPMGQGPALVLLLGCLSDVVIMAVLLGSRGGCSPPYLAKALVLSSV